MLWHRWRCGGSLVALQTSEAEVPGSNPASLYEDRQSQCAIVHTVKSRVARDPPLRQENKAK